MTTVYEDEAQWVEIKRYPGQQAVAWRLKDGGVLCVVWPAIMTEELRAMPAFKAGRLLQITCSPEDVVFGQMAAVRQETEVIPVRTKEPAEGVFENPPLVMFRTTLTVDGQLVYEESKTQ